MKDMVGSCCVCSDDRGWPENPLVYCDGQSCTVAVHQACYGIVTVPTGPWYCRKCESQERSVKVKCELCPSKYGALKRTDNSGWAHVVCALYIPEVRFGNVTTMEPIQLQLIPQERFNKVCYICEQNGKPSSASVGACMQCNKSGCKQQFHVTCAQSLGLLCEEAGNYLDNVKYCGYCQHHYSKLKKGGNVKTIPPYKPISAENQASDSSSEKETDSKSSSALGKRKSSIGSKSSLSKAPTSTKTTSSSTSSSSSYSKGSASSSTSSSNSNAKSDKVKSSASAKSSAKDESAGYETNDAKVESKRDEKERPDSGDKDRDKEKGKKRKANSRTPTPSIVSEGESASAKKEAKESGGAGVESSSQESKKKLKISVAPAERQSETTAPVLTASVAPATSQAHTASNGGAAPPTVVAAQPPQALPTPPPGASHSIIQSAPPPPPPQQLNSVVVSVPLHNTSLSASPRPNAIAATANIPLPDEKKPPTPPVAPKSLTPEASTPPKMITSELSSTGLKITFEKQTVNALPIDDGLDPDEPMKRSRSQSSEKTEKSKSKKRGSNGLMQGLSTMTIKKTGKTQSVVQSTPPNSATTFVNLAANRESVKDSPPSSPSSESLGAAPTTVAKKRGRKSNAQLAAQAAAAAQAAQAAAVAQQQAQVIGSNKDTKDNLKLFQNGVNAPHMLGNQLNLNSNMAHKMTEHLNSEMEAHSIFSSNDSSNLVGPPLQHRVIASARSSSVGGSSTASGGSGLSSMLGGTGTIPQTLDQLLERQWEQGSQFLMEQAQHFDIASLLSCLHQLRAENLRLEEHVNSLLQRRDHLLAVNARLAIPLTPPATPQSNHPHTVNNIHPAVSHVEASRPRHSSGYPPHVQGVPQHPPSMENGIAPDAYPHAHRSPAGTQPPQPSPRQSSSGYASSGFSRQSIESAAGRGHAGHRFNANQYYNSAMQLANAQQQQVVIRTDHPHMPHKPSNG